FFQAEDGIRSFHVTGVQTCALPIFSRICDLPWPVPVPCKSASGPCGVPARRARAPEGPVLTDPPKDRSLNGRSSPDGGTGVDPVRPVSRRAAAPRLLSV